MGYFCIKLHACVPSLSRGTFHRTTRPGKDFILWKVAGGITPKHPLKACVRCGGCGWFQELSRVEKKEKKPPLHQATNPWVISRVSEPVVNSLVAFLILLSTSFFA